VSVLAQQRWYEAYEDALAAIKRQEWTKAEQQLKLALQLNPKQGRRVLFYGTRREDYLPEYLLAVVYANQQRAQEALDLFAKVERDGLVPNGSREYPEMQRLAGSARAQLDKERLARNPPPPEVRPPVAAGGGGAVAANPPGGAGGGGVRPADDPAAAAARAEAQRRERFGVLVTQAAADIDARRFDEARARVSEARGLGVDPGRVADLDRRLAIGSAERAVEDAIARRNWADAQRLAKELRQLDAGHARLAGFDAAIGRGLASITAIRSALRAFFGGDYQQTLRLLEPLSRNPDATPRMLFYLACSNVALALLEGPKGQVRLEQGRQLYARVRANASELASDRRFISPQILQALERRGP
jgi:hypothetical protein